MKDKMKKLLAAVLTALMVSSGIFNADLFAVSAYAGDEEMITGEQETTDASLIIEEEETAEPAETNEPGETSIIYEQAEPAETIAPDEAAEPAETDGKEGALLDGDSAAATDTDAFIKDPKLRSVLRILVNYQKKNSTQTTKADYYKRVRDPYTTDITTNSDAGTYSAPITQADLENYSGRVILSPYTDITTLQGLNYGRNITEIVLPATLKSKETLKSEVLTSIEGKAFYEMISLTKVTMPKTIISIGDSAFEKCKKLESIFIYDTDPSKPETQAAGILNLKYVTDIGLAAFASCIAVKNVTFYSGTEKIRINSNAFTSCTSLEKVTVPNAELGTGIFAACYRLSSVTFNDAITVIPNNTLSDIGTTQNDKGLYLYPATIHFPKNLEEIGAYACTGARIDSYNLTICTKLKKIGICAFQNANLYANCKMNLGACKELTSIGHSAFAGMDLKKGSTAVVLPDTVSELGAGAFVGCTLTEINIPASLTFIPDGSFMQCTSLEKVTAPSTSKVTYVGSHAFELCGHLKNIGFLSSMKGLTEIRDYAFSKCIPTRAEVDEGFSDDTAKGLRLLNVPNTVTSLGKSVFENDFLVRDIAIGTGITALPERMMICEDANSPTWQDVQFTDPVSGSTISYAYRSDSGFSGFRSQYSYQSSLRNQSRLEQTTLPATLTSIGDYAFFGNSHLAKLNPDNTGMKKMFLPASLTSIGAYAFARCSSVSGSQKNKNLAVTGIEYVKLPDADVAIGDYAFAYNVNLDNFVFTKALSKIPAHCFDGSGYTENLGDGKYFYDGLHVISDISNLSVIGDYAFNNCSNLVGRSDGGKTYGDDFDFGTVLTSLGQYAFAGTGIKSAMTLSSTQIGTINANTFDSCRNLEMVYCPDTLQSIGNYAFRNCPKLRLINFPVYADLSLSMIAGDTQSITLTPTLGEFRDTRFRIPVTQTIILPANAFAKYSTQTISQLNTDGTVSELSKLDPEKRYFNVTFEKNQYKVTGNYNEVKNTAVRISVSVPFTSASTISMSIDYPADVVAFHADPTSMAFALDQTKIDSRAAGVTPIQEGDVPVLMLSRNNAGHTLILSASAQSTEERYRGIITDPVYWKVISGDALSVREDSVTKTIDDKEFGNGKCTTTAVFDIRNGDEAVVKMYFDDGTADPPSKTVIVRMIDAISAINYSLSSIGTGHMNPGSIAMPVGQEDTIEPVPVYPNPEDERDFLTYRSGDASIVSVDAAGKFTALKAGRTQITIGTASASTSRSFTVTVKEQGEPIEPAFVEVKGGKYLVDGRAYVYTGGTSKYSAVCLPDYSTQSVTWTLNDTESASIATTETQAVLTGRVTDKTVTLTARSSYSSPSASQTVLVMDKATSLTFAETPPVIESGSIRSLILSGNESQTNGIIRLPATSQDNVTFTSSNVSVLKLGTNPQLCDQKTIKISGKTATIYYQGLKKGTATITAKTVGGLTTKLKVTVVKDPITSLAYKDAQITMIQGEKKKPTLTIQPSNTNEQVTYTSDNPAVASVSSTGAITAKADGVTWIRARSQIRGASASIMVTVIGIGKKVSLDGNTYTVNKDKTLTFTGVSFNAEEVTIPATVNVSGRLLKVTKIDSKAFRGNSNVTKVVIGSKVASIPARAFENCTSLTTVTIGAGVKTIGKLAFKKCSFLKKVIIKSKVLTKIGSKAFKTISKGAVFKCPKNKRAAYTKLLVKSGLPAGYKIV